MEKLIEFLLDQITAEMGSKNAGFLVKLKEAMNLNHTLSKEKLDGDKLIAIEFLAKRITQLLEEV